MNRSLPHAELLSGGRPIPADGTAETFEACARELYERAQAAWPSFRLEPSDFLPYVRERLPKAWSLAALRRIRAADLYLACACARGTPAALLAFETQHLGRLTRQLSASGFDAQVATEVQQTLRERLLVAPPGKLPRIASYAGLADLSAWVRTSALRLAVELQRGGVPPGVSLEEVALEVEASADSPEMAVLRQQYGDRFRQAFSTGLAELTVRERNVLRQYFIDELTIDQLGGLYGIHRATAARWVASARQKLAQQTRKQLMASMQISPSETSRVIRMVRSSLNLSVRRYLGARAEPE